MYTEQDMIDFGNYCCRDEEITSGSITDWYKCKKDAERFVAALEWWKNIEQDMKDSLLFAYSMDTSNYGYSENYISGKKVEEIYKQFKS